jgi:hypothetical protein
MCRNSRHTELACYKATEAAAYAASPIQVDARTSPRTEEDAEKRPSSGYGKPRQPDASDLRAATSVANRFATRHFCKQRAAHNSASRALFINDKSSETRDVHAATNS